MIETFSIQEEKFINEIYYLSLNVSFNKKKIFNFLESKNIFPSLPVKKSIFFIPIILDENENEILMFSESNLFNRWNSNTKNYHLLKYILPTEDLEDFNLIKRNSKNLENYDFKEIIQKYNLEDYIITIIFKNNEQIRVLNKINFNKKIDLKNLNFKNINLNDDKEIEKFTENLKSIFEDYWKSKNEINTSVKLPIKISIDNQNNSKISDFENILANIDLIYDFNIYKFNNKKNIYKIIFNGSPDYFLKIMKNENYELDTQNQVWKIK
jgi:ATP-dependent Lon protease